MTKDQIKKKFSDYCMSNKFGELKYWNPAAFGYADNDMECSMDKFFPQKVWEVFEKLLDAYADLKV